MHAGSNKKYKTFQTLVKMRFEYYFAGEWTDKTTIGSFLSHE